MDEILEIVSKSFGKIQSFLFFSNFKPFLEILSVRFALSFILRQMEIFEVPCKISKDFVDQ